MARRRTLEIPGVSHPAPIPMGCRVGDTIHSSALMGMDPATGVIPDEGDEQVRLVFDNARTLLEVGDASPDDVVYVRVLLEDDDLRQAVNACWVEMFPDPLDRPARHTTKVDLPGAMKVQLELIAVVEPST